MSTTSNPAILQEKRGVNKRDILREMKLKGFKPVPDHATLLINELGTVYNLEYIRFEKLDGNNRIRFNECESPLSVPKLMLLTFRNEPYRETQHISYLDGNKDNVCLSNVKYSRMFEKGLRIELNTENLIMAIRCYFQIKSNFQIKNNIIARNYLEYIAEYRCFFKKSSENIEVFKTYLKWDISGIQKTARIHNISVIDCTIIIYGFLNMLSSEVLEDRKAKRLKMLDLLPKHKTKTQILKDYNNSKKGLGFDPIPLRKQSKVKCFKKYLESLKVSDNQNNK